MPGASSYVGEDRDAPDLSRQHFAKMEYAKLKRQPFRKEECARFEPQALRKDRHASDSSHRPCAKTEMHQTRATATSLRQKCGSQKQKCARFEPRPQETIDSKQTCSKDSYSIDDCRPLLPKRRRYTCGVLRSE